MSRTQDEDEAKPSRRAAENGPALKRSMTIAGHRTSIALEMQFWEALEDLAAMRSLSLPELVRHIDESHAQSNLSSALRVAALEWYRDRPRSG